MARALEPARWFILGLWAKDKNIRPRAVEDALSKQDSFEKRDTPGYKQIARYLDELNREESKRRVFAEVDGLGQSSEISEDEWETDIRGRTIYRALEVIEPPSLDALIESGVPKKQAPQLLADWDIAYREQDRYQTNVYSRLVAILGDAEWKGIPYPKALLLARLEIKGEEFGIAEHIRETTDISKRYRPWESKEQESAFRRVFKYVIEKDQSKRAQRNRSGR